MHPRTVALLADCGGQIGLGHLRRVLVLGKAFAEVGLRARIATPEGTGNAQVEAAGLEPLPWPKQPRDLARHDLLVVDHYGLDAATMAAWRKAAAFRLAIDDLADHPLDADLILNQNLFAAELNYDAIASCPVLRGPGYALVDSAFHAAALERKGTSGRVLVSFGGSDDGTLALKVVRALRRAGFDGPVDAVVSPLRDTLPELLEATASPSAALAVHRGATMAALMADAFLYVGGAGTTIFEAAVADLAMLPIGIAENQRRSVEALCRLGVEALMGLDEDRLEKALRRVLDNPAHARLRNVVAPDGVRRVIDCVFARLALRDRSELSLCLRGDAPW